MMMRKLAYAVFFLLSICLIGAAGTDYAVRWRYPAPSDAYGTAMEQSWLQALAEARREVHLQALEDAARWIYVRALNKLPPETGEAAVFEYWYAYAPYVDQLPYPDFAKDETRVHEILEALTTAPMQGEVMDKVMRSVAAFQIWQGYLRKDTLDTNQPGAYVFSRMWMGAYDRMLANMPLYSEILISMDGAALKQHADLVPEDFFPEAHQLTLAAWRYALTRAIPSHKPCHQMHLSAYLDVMEKVSENQKKGYLAGNESILEHFITNPDFKEVRRKIQKKCDVDLGATAQ